ncbi:hypothetical protein HUK80_07275 [Flavobacterium sp. MAH-1]|uniref:Uncharacterized protein n=1 Tax=Flavobacterium agri TaxID=2743471 RepID=A0A7Y9C5S3_9FLAO|nr:hypothetical protein [Flavobacterium agri]NUY80690.1 hypothetical protein [Flavobacterium agri]NYA70714.1 hypothetical protein [Flavobacterium agri]
MKTQLTTQALNLMISERFAHRLQCGQLMKETVESEYGLTPLAEIFKKHFFSHIDKCVENPNCESRRVLFALADFWTVFFKTKEVWPLSAA